MEALARLILRLSIGGMLLLHGIHKISYGNAAVASIVAQHGLPHFISYGVYIGEVIAPIFVILGLYTRPAALLMVCNMAVALFLVHAHQFTSISANGGWRIELQMLFLLGSVCIALLGSGRYSVNGGTGRWN